MNTEENSEPFAYGEPFPEVNADEVFQSDQVDHYPSASAEYLNQPLDIDNDFFDIMDGISLEDFDADMMDLTSSTIALPVDTQFPRGNNFQVYAGVSLTEPNYPVIEGVPDFMNFSPFYPSLPGFNDVSGVTYAIPDLCVSSDDNKKVEYVSGNYVEAVKYDGSKVESVKFDGSKIEGVKYEQKKVEGVHCLGYPERAVLNKQNTETVQSETLHEIRGVVMDDSDHSISEIKSKNKKTPSNRRFPYTSITTQLIGKKPKKELSAPELSARQQATAKRQRVKGKFKKIQTKWIAATEFFSKKSNSDSDGSNI